MRFAHFFSAAFWALSTLACGQSSERDDDDTDDDGAPTPEPSGAGSCRGTAWGCNDLALPYPTDVAGCTAQLGCSWDFEFEYCGEGPPRTCESFDERAGCIRQVGCEWAEGGEVETSMKLGDCVGTPVPCTEYMDQSSCNNQPACLWGGSSFGCETDYDEVSVGYDCTTWSVDDIEQDGHPLVNMNACQKRAGCSWEGDTYSE